VQAIAPYREAFSIAVRSLNAAKLRSFLTLLGVILATTTLIVVMSMVHGMDVYVAKQVSDMGSDGFRVQRIPLLGDFDPKKYLELEMKNPKLTVEEFQFLKKHADLLQGLAIEAGQSAAVHYHAAHLDGVSLIGATANYAGLSNIEIASGRFLTETENQRRAAIAIIGNDVRERLFPQDDPAGKSILVGGSRFEVIGLAAKRGSVFGQSRDNFVIIPLGAFLKTFGARPELSFIARALDHDRLRASQDEVRTGLRAFRRLRPGQPDNFGLMASDSLVGLWDRLTGVLAAMAVGIVSIFMVVGGVVIMNIMLATVVERTYEIGIRKAVGARSRDILSQFLIESSLLSASGGLVGVGLAWIVALTVRNGTSMPMAVPPSAVVLGVGIATIVGLFFGVYPARRAARLDPIQALRWER